MAQAEFHLGGVLLSVTMEITAITPMYHPGVRKTSPVPTTSVRIEQLYQPRGTVHFSGPPRSSDEILCA